MIDRKKIQVKDKLEYQTLIKVVTFDLSKNVTDPHKHNGYLELVFLSSTTGRHYIDGRETIIKTPCLLVIKKDNVHHWELTNPVKGLVLLVKNQFVDQSLDFEINRLVDRISQFDTIYFNQATTIENLLELLAVEENRACQEGLFKAILAKVLEYTTDSRRSRSVQHDIYIRFCALLNEDPRVVNHVAYYASKLHTSPQNLNAACKRNINLTASEVLAGCIIKEAKRLLLYTTNSISEVAYKLGFSDKSNFSKYFKRYTGITPTDFRKQES
ncbi:AraC family transcriptional regulator [Sphingobacterium sp. SGR-19]|uniref:AraC family transcriptional regulator n=1 Tax=Sphingobacterium sp. SGR-19 TaxID=2710886 RepID=UPI0013EC669D|nr:helix-turn-helix transcriptional regulator [Sphingobacterium sp. SGR-19]NGM63939.1 helix-turn-helix domain-containing protein [Sphingobacterium sp. SGR-19]